MHALFSLGSVAGGGGPSPQCVGLSLLRCPLWARSPCGRKQHVFGAYGTWVKMLHPMLFCRLYPLPFRCGASASSRKLVLSLSHLISKLGHRISAQMSCPVPSHHTLPGTARVWDLILFEASMSPHFKSTNMVAVATTCCHLCKITFETSKAIPQQKIENMVAVVSTHYCAQYLSSFPCAMSRRT